MTNPHPSRQPQECAVRSDWPRFRLFDGFPYLSTVIVNKVSHINLLPADWPSYALRDLARRQVAANRLPACLVVEDGLCLYLEPDGSERWSDDTPEGGVVVTDGLLLPHEFSMTDDLRVRYAALQVFAAAATLPEDFFRQDFFKNGRCPTEEEAARLAGEPMDGVPRGLERCPICGERYRVPSRG